MFSCAASATWHCASRPGWGPKEVTLMATVQPFNNWPHYALPKCPWSRSVGIERRAFPEEPSWKRGWPLWFLRSGAVTQRSSTKVLVHSALRWLCQISCHQHGVDEELHERFLGNGSQWRVRMAVCDRRADDLNINIQLCNWDCREDPEAKADSSSAHTKNSGNTAAWGSCSSSSDACQLPRHHHRLLLG